MNIFDSHAHYNDKRFETETEGVHALLSQMFAGEVKRIINIAVDTQSSYEVIEQAKQYGGMFCAVGYHPENCLAVQNMQTALAEIEALIKDEQTRKQNKIVAIGEIGLDYHTENFLEGKLDKEKQKAFFEAQLCLAEQYNLPVIVHDREAHGDCFEAILKHPKVRGVFHCFSGSPELAVELTRRGWYLGFGGTITYKNSLKAKEAVKVCPLDKLLIETDSPYLAPQTFRGKINHSDYLTFVLDTLSELLNIEKDKIAQITYQNAQNLFQIP